MKISIKLFIIFFIHFFLLLSLQAEYKGKGYKAFKKAYKLESTSEKSAAKLFFKAIDMGLKKEYKIIAYWHLYTIAKKEKENDFAFLCLSKIVKLKYSKKTKKKLAKLKLQLQQKIKLSGTSFHRYIRGLFYFYHAPEKTHHIWKKLMKGEQTNKFLMKRYLELLSNIDKKNTDEENLLSVSYLDKNKDLYNENMYLYKRTKLYYRLEMYSKARENIEMLFETLSDSKEDGDTSSGIFLFKSIYLCAKIYQKQKDFQKAYLFYRLAANYTPFQDSMLFLASYMQFRMKNYVLAYYIIKDNYIPEKGLSAILYNVLKVILYNKKSSRNYLKKYKKEIKARYKLKATILLRKAIKFAH